MSVESLRVILPEIALVVAAVAIYLLGAFWKSQRAWSWAAGLSLVAAAVVLWMQGPGDEVLRGASSDTWGGGPFRSDALARFGQWLALGLGGLLTLGSARLFGGGRRHPGEQDCPVGEAAGPRFDGTSEYVGSLLLTIAGLMLVTVAADLVLLFVALELISIPTYILLYLGRNDAESQESAVKYFFLSVLSSAILLYGFSFLCGMAGFAGAPGGHDMTQLVSVRAAMDSGRLGTLAVLTLVLVVAGLSFRVAAVPFHFYAPDVYQGTTHPNAALLSVVPKAAGLVALVRIVVEAMPSMAAEAWPLVLAVALLTMSVANVMALWQDNLRRLLAYSSIAQAGYLLLALAVALAGGSRVGAWNGLATLWFYLTTYSLATIGAFAVLEHLGSPERRVDSMDELAGLGRTRPAVAGALALCMLSLTGVPPLAGFWGKLLVFGAALDASASADGLVAMARQVGNLPHNLHWWFITAAVVGVLNAAVAAAYYLRVVGMLYFRTPSARLRPEGGRGAWAAALLCAAAVVAIGVDPGPLVRAASDAGRTTDGVRSTERARSTEREVGAGLSSWSSDFHRLTSGIRSYR
ncbi:MAG: NADH-quinone oxidoreductase subunit N [Thermoguttaceae bacterium]